MRLLKMLTQEHAASLTADAYKEDEDCCLGVGVGPNLGEKNECEAELMRKELTHRRDEL